MLVVAFSDVCACVRALRKVRRLILKRSGHHVKIVWQDTGPTTVVHKDQTFFNATHQKYITSLASQTDTFAYWAAEYL